ncbi:Hypothetical predicted protein [Podarcis lilfordi]|uniref:Uncharacterized protein n=1 Tax=Podarcis lilfordi TaxID=74358 RepID=A0AA35K8C2_9SAUR|nr:Hypothetical predicted protein [Podarcis lilfordi]
MLGNVVPLVIKPQRSRRQRNYNARQPSISPARTLTCRADPSPQYTSPNPCEGADGTWEELSGDVQRKKEEGLLLDTSRHGF